MSTAEERANLLEATRRRFPDADPLRPNGWGCGQCGALYNFQQIYSSDGEPTCPNGHLGWEWVFPQTQPGG